MCYAEIEDRQENHATAETCQDIPHEDRFIRRRNKK